jgi:hypothetical protein
MRRGGSAWRHPRAPTSECPHDPGCRQDGEHAEQQREGDGYQRGRPDGNQAERLTDEVGEQAAGEDDVHHGAQEPVAVVARASSNARGLRGLVVRGGMQESLMLTSLVLESLMPESLVLESLVLESLMPESHERTPSERAGCASPRLRQCGRAWLCSSCANPECSTERRKR